jgi:hypothetical protein
MCPQTLRHSDDLLNFLFAASAALQALSYALSKALSSFVLVVFFAG